MLWLRTAALEPRSRGIDWRLSCDHIAYMGEKTETFRMRVTPQWLAEIDAWRRREPDLPPRAEAVRRLVMRGLSDRGAEQRNDP